MAGTIVVAGAMAQKPREGGHTWVLLQYLLGFRRLGWEVLFLDQLEPELCVDDAGQPCPLDRSLNVRSTLEVLARFGLSESFALVCDRGSTFVGLPRRQVLDRVRGSALLLNVMGFLKDPEILGRAPRRVFLDIDPGFGQIWRELGLHDPFRDHDDFVTIGENIGRPACTIPTCGLDWITTPPSIVLEHWRPAAPVEGGRFTSVVSWRGRFGPLEYRGKVYGLRVHEFRKFAGLPRITGRPFQLALDIHPDETKDLALLAENGWSLVDPKVVARDPWSYRDFIRGSKAELMIPKNMYVESNSGWVSDRSLCYLASGRPVLARDTGLGDRYPGGEGLLRFTTMDEAVAGVATIEGEYPRQARGARALAEEYFDSDRVLARLLAKLGVA